jgi:UDP-glucose 4-epimerase
MKKILVSGGMGYIGSHTTVELLNLGYEVIIADNLSTSSKEVLPAIKEITGKSPSFVELDFADEKATNIFFKEHSDIDAIIHFAAHKSVNESVDLPLKYYRNNLFSMVNVLSNMEKYGIDNLVFSSSCTVYGQAESLPVKEDSPVQTAENPYGNTKQICEEMIRDTSLALEIKAIALRYFNPIGAHESAKIGELPIGVPNNLVPYITQTGIGKRECLSVFGKDYNTKDGTAIRDYIHVVDLAKAHIIAIERLLNNNNKKAYEIFNLGTGNGYSVLEAIQSFEKVSGLKLNHKLVDRRKGDIEQIWADTEYANKELGWKAERGLDEMLLSAWKWEQHLEKK